MTDATVDAAEKSSSTFVQKVKHLFVKNEGLVQKEIKALTEAGKEIPAGLKAGNIRWGNTIVGLAGLGGLAVLASVVASTGNKGPGKFSEQETARQQEQTPGAGVGVA